MQKITEIILDNISLGELTTLSEKCNLTTAQAQEIMADFVSGLVSGLSAARSHEMLHLIGGLTGAVNSESIQALAETPLIANTIRSTLDTIKDKYSLEHAQLQVLVTEMLPVIMRTIQEKYGQNPLSILEILNSQQSPLAGISSLADSLGGMFHKQQ